MKRKRGKRGFQNARETEAGYLRNFVFGVEDSLVSTVGLISGIAIASVPRQTILLTGLVLIFVEAVSMAAGSFLSEHSAEGYLKRNKASLKIPVKKSAIMFFSYFIAGFIPLFPYLLFSVSSALLYSVSSSIIALLLLGALSARLTRTNVLREALEMAVIGGIAIAVGLIVGRLLG